MTSQYAKLSCMSSEFCRSSCENGKMLSLCVCICVCFQVVVDTCMVCQQCSLVRAACFPVNTHVLFDSMCTTFSFSHTVYVSGKLLCSDFGCANARSTFARLPESTHKPRQKRRRVCVPLYKGCVWMQIIVCGVGVCAWYGGIEKVQIDKLQTPTLHWWESKQVRAGVAWQNGWRRKKRWGWAREEGSKSVRKRLIPGLLKLRKS